MAHSCASLHHVVWAWSVSEHLQGQMKYMIIQGFQTMVLMRWGCYLLPRTPPPTPRPLCVCIQRSYSKLQFQIKSLRKKIYLINQVHSCRHQSLCGSVHVSAGAQGIQKGCLIACSWSYRYLWASRCGPPGLHSEGLSQNKNELWGWRDGSEAKSTGGSLRGSKLESLYPHGGS